MSEQKTCCIEIAEKMCIAWQAATTKKARKIVDREKITRWKVCNSLFDGETIEYIAGLRRYDSQQKNAVFIKEKGTMRWLIVSIFMQRHLCIGLPVYRPPIQPIPMPLYFQCIFNTDMKPGVLLDFCCWYFCCFVYLRGGSQFIDSIYQMKNITSLAVRSVHIPLKCRLNSWIHYEAFWKMDNQSNSTDILISFSRTPMKKTQRKNNSHTHRVRWETATGSLWYYFFFCETKNTHKKCTNIRRTAASGTRTNDFFFDAKHKSAWARIHSKNRRKKSQKQRKNRNNMNT